MKKALLLTFNLIFILHTWGQGSYIQTLNTIGDKFHIASLPKNTSQNYQKLQIEIFGGSFYSNNLGTRVYSISSRDVDGTIERVKIVKEQKGGASDNYILKVMETSNGYDIILESSKPWLSINIQSSLSFSSGGGSSITPITTQQITKYNGNGVDITNTSKVQLISIYSTNSQGNVGIGTDNPQNKLDVAGTIRATEVKVETGWADFVFDKDYKLPTLQEVENHINEHNHLPDIPSEAEVKENGVSIGEMQAKLLQKIEELTLYVIQQDKTIKNLENKVQKLEAK
ncbi:hypothetical protein [Dysgonomonas capnocytophagoides]|uniref:hypothetical protein n=1 Tax=Dysgonomonas capnocytophagoides TaxID=45254 RepID=UPI00333EE07A